MKISKEGFIIFENEEESNIFKLGYLMSTIDKIRTSKLREDIFKRRIKEYSIGFTEERKRIDNKIKEEMEVAKILGLI